MSDMVDNATLAYVTALQSIITQAKSNPGFSSLIKQRQALVQQLASINSQLAVLQKAQQALLQHQQTQKASQ